MKPSTLCQLTSAHFLEREMRLIFQKQVMPTF